VSKRFIVALAEGTKAQHDAFTKAVKATGAGWWHWLPEVWLISDPRVDASAITWRDLARSHYPGTRVIALEVTPAMWAVYGPEASFDWLRQYWQ
jgi:hypothetical protein